MRVADCKKLAEKPEGFFRQARKCHPQGWHFFLPGSFEYGRAQSSCHHLPGGPAQTPKCPRSQISRIKIFKINSQYRETGDCSGRIYAAAGWHCGIVCGWKGESMAGARSRIMIISIAGTRPDFPKEVCSVIVHLHLNRSQCSFVLPYPKQPGKNALSCFGPCTTGAHPRRCH